MTIHTSLARLPMLLLMAPLGLWAATPSSGTLTDISGPRNYVAGPFNVANPTPVPQVDVGPECNNPSQPCDEYALTLTLPVGYHALHPNATVKITAGWTDGGSGSSDYDLYVYQGTVTATDGSQQAYSQSASGNNPEVAGFGPLADGTAQFTVLVVPYTPSGESVNVKIELLAGSGGGSGGGSFGGPDPTVPGAPRYQNFYAPHGTSAEPGNGEFNIGFNPATHRIMTMNTGPIWRLTPAEVVNAANPESCDALWEDKSDPATSTGLDPILWTDQKTGRTFASNTTTGAAGSAYSDNDGDLWTPTAAPPNGGADHQTIGTGPFPASLSILTTPVNQGEYALYCSQDIVGPATCQRSVDLGATYGPAVPAYTGSGTQGCGGLHGHVHIAANGTAWLPVNQCSGKQGGALSTDAGTTWSEFAVTGSRSQVNGADPSIALDSASTAYYCYVNNEPVPMGNAPEGHVHVKVSTDGGLTWIRDVDVGAGHGIVNASHTEAVGGSLGRAACGFIGTNVPGDYQSLAFPGLWYAFIATTFDGGLTWTTVNATPNDPVQSKTGVWQQGGGNQDRNLLDFNEVTMDDKGRVLYGYSDGCVTPTCITGNGTDDFTAWMRVARQIGGKGLLAPADPVEPAPPKRACLAGSRDPAAAHLSWKVPDNNGKDIIAYDIYRGAASGSETYLGQVQRVESYDDATADPNVPAYYYTIKAINLSGTGNDSNEVTLTSVVPPPPGSICTAPGVTKLTDPAGDATASGGAPAPAGTDLLSFQLEQPLALDGVVKLMFTINTDAGISPQAPGSAWYVAMKIADATPAGFHYRAVHMAWSGTSPTFESYTPGANNSGGVDGRFVTAGSQVPAEFGSYDTPFTKIVIGVKASDLGLSPGDVIIGFVSGTTQTTDPAGIGAGATQAYDLMPNSGSFMGGPYTVGNSFDCDVIFRNGFE